ncbi:hypothetical protein LIER_39939 [Lithospermum erythrorhizon]|uniref:Uncharacterized protein n=1 Tax=Lithospermum erythrorhizon TaxID=34254 RepID=A0AAV3QME5_LITER
MDAEILRELMKCSLIEEEARPVMLDEEDLSDEVIECEASVYVKHLWKNRGWSLDFRKELISERPELEWGGESGCSGNVDGGEDGELSSPKIPLGFESIINVEREVNDIRGPLMGNDGINLRFEFKLGGIDEGGRKNKCSLSAVMNEGKGKKVMVDFEAHNEKLAVILVFKEAKFQEGYPHSLTGPKDGEVGKSPKVGTHSSGSRKRHHPYQKGINIISPSKKYMIFVNGSKDDDYGDQTAQVARQPSRTS